MVVSTGVEIVLGLFANHTFNVPVFLAPGGETASIHTGLKRRVSALPALSSYLSCSRFTWTTQQLSADLPSLDLATVGSVTC